MVDRRTPEREVGGSILTQVAVLCPEQDTFTSQKILVIPRKRWLRPDMTEKLFTGTLSKNEMKRKYFWVYVCVACVVSVLCVCVWGGGVLKNL